MYNVTLSVEEEILEEWLEWMKSEHLPEVMATGKFVSNAMYRIFNHEASDKSNNYSVQYLANTMHDYDDYVKNYGPALRQKTIERFGDKVLAFRTLLEKVI